MLVAGVAVVSACGARVSEAERRQAVTRAQLASSMLMEREFASALREARRSIELDPECVDCRYTLATVYSARAEWEQAEAELQRVLAIDPDYSYAHNQLAVVYLNSGRPGEAETHARRAAEDEEFSGRHLAFYNLGWSLLERQRYDEALEAFGNALRENPRMCSAEYRIGEVYFRQRSYEEALRHLEQAVVEDQSEDRTSSQPREEIQHCSNMPDAHHLLGMTLLALGEVERAQESFRRCVELATERTDLGRRCAQHLEGQE
jgi:tetratricopeptide (TPR) repeat protein